MQLQYHTVVQGGFSAGFWKVFESFKNVLDVIHWEIPGGYRH